MPKALGRNDLCRCGSGKKYKHCCLEKDNKRLVSKTALFAIAIVVLIGLALGGISFMDEGSDQSCPPGTVWSEAHGHCH